MTAPPILRRLREAGARVSLDGDEIVVRAPRDTVTPDLVDDLREAKPEVVRFLRERPTWPCELCGRFHFAGPSVICYWCRHAQARPARA